jgi:2-succinyl-6-hydroxy-2,4-cyclohexadiene-1-carboxylate synthase
MPLHADRRGQGPPLVLVHGFTQTRRCWGPEVDRLALDHEVICVDAPGHGRSSDGQVDLREGARLLVETGGDATYLGYSMGARFALHVALEAPTAVRGLVLLSGTAGIEDEAERAARRAQDHRTSERLAAEGLETFLDGWLRQPLFATLPPGRAFRSERLENTVAGLRASLDHAGTGSQVPVWDRLASLAMPVLVLAGSTDAKFVDLAERMAATIGANATLTVIEGAGHAAHLEQPDRFLTALQPWLAAHEL